MHTMSSSFTQRSVRRLVPVLGRIRNPPLRRPEMHCHVPINHSLLLFLQLVDTRGAPLSWLL